MTSLTHVPGSADFSAPRQTWRSVAARFAKRVLALDTLFRERAHLVELDDRALRDIGLGRADIDGALSAPDAHLRSILIRGLR